MKNSGAIIQRARAGFTLIEMIAVLAVMAILASVVTPNILHSIEVAAVKAEADTLHAFGTQMGLYMRDNRGAMPVEGNGNWNVQLATYASLNSADVLTNKRQMARLYVIDPVVTNYRAMIISSMRSQVALPPWATARTNFQAIWNAPENTVPPGGGWGGWGAGPSPALNNIEYLVIERVNLASVQKIYFAQYHWSLNNNSTTDSVSCLVTWANGATPTTYNLGVSATLNSWNTVPLANRLTKLTVGDTLAFYKTGTPAALFSYVVNDTPKSFTYTTGWVAQ